MLEADAPPATRLFATRLGIGLAQGLSLYALNRWQGELIPWVLGALAMTASLLPVTALGTIGATGRRTALAWLSAAALITLVIGGYALYVYPPGARWNGAGPPAPVRTVAFTAVTLFILHHLIIPADAEGRWRASFSRYFDDAWKDAVRLALAVGFVGALWVLLWLGAALFKLIGLDFLQRLITKPWFAFPATTVFFALAAHVTDIRIGLVRGARTLALSLLSWLMPVLALIAGAFLLALPFTGLRPLLATRTSSGVMLAACAALIVLINATYQDGERDGFPPRVLKWVTRIAAAELAPMALVAAYGLALRIGQHGLSPERIYACACVLLAACYAAGYLWAAVSPGVWMRRLETTNWITAQVAVVVLLALFSPLLDPARLSVASQVHRLQAGSVAPKDFDYAFLRFSSGRWGATALARLAGSGNAQIAALATAEQHRRRPWETPALSASERAGAIQAVSAPLPADFLSQAWSADNDPAHNCAPDPRRPQGSAAACEAIVTDLDDAPGEDVIVFSPQGSRVYGRRNGAWTPIGQLANGGCAGDLEAVQQGKARLVTAPATAVELNGRRLVFVPDAPCPQDTRKGR